jgi:peptidoglycan hydrolase-like protein with peptidoglycan-binding domain
MSLVVNSPERHCFICSRDVTDRPIGRSVGSAGANVKADVLLVQELLNSVPPDEGGPDLLLAEDGLIGPKTQAAINKFQRSVLPHPDGRIDPDGPTIKALAGVICDLPAIPPGRLGLVARPNQVAGKPPTPATATGAVATQAIKDGKQILKDLEPRIRSLRFKLTHQFPSTTAFCNKHFATGKSKVLPSEIDFINRLVGAIHFHVARFNVFGIQLIENVILFDPKDAVNNGWTVRGGDKLSTKQFQIYVQKGKTIKAPGQSVFLTSGFAGETGFEKHLTVLHEMTHFVGPRDGTGIQIDDHAQAFESKFLSISKFQKLHNAETISLFMLEACVGTEGVIKMPRLAPNKNHFSTFPKVSANGDIVTN